MSPQAARIVVVLRVLFFLVGACVVLSLDGCGDVTAGAQPLPDAGPGGMVGTGPAGEGGSDGAAGAGGQVAAGGSTGAAGAVAPPSFAGNWTFTSGTLVHNCAGATVADVDLTGTVATITAPDPTHLLLSTSGGITCSGIRFTATGGAAVVVPGQTCWVGTSAVAVTSWTISVVDDVATTSMAGSETVAVVSCSPTARGTLAR
jgi:hypothetical protein